MAEVIHILTKEAKKEQYYNYHTLIFLNFGLENGVHLRDIYKQNVMEWIRQH